MSPERGALQLAVCAVLNAIWDLWAKAEQKPLWKLVCDMTPEQFVSCIDFRYLTDVLTPEQALEMLRKLEPTKKERIQLALGNKAVPAYNTSAGWLGHSDETVRKLVREAASQGFKHFKLKAGLGLETDRKRLSLVRGAVGEDGILMIDVNQLWDVDEAIEYVKKLADLKLWFIEEPTSPDDVLGHARIRSALKPWGVGVATGEHVNSTPYPVSNVGGRELMVVTDRVMFKQLLQANALDAVQLDACRLAGVNEILSVLLLSAKFGVPVVPHSGFVQSSMMTCNASNNDIQRCRYG
jgi:L-galactonate dehydratase